MPKRRLPAFDPADVAESNATSYPAVFRADNSKRWNRRLGDHVGIANFGVNLTRLVIGDRTPFDEIDYPDIDNHATAGADGRYAFTRKDGSPHE
jgi:uncharacterized cupin superfamily protein